MSKKLKISEEDYVKINKALAREEEMNLLGPGFHSKHKIHKSKKTYCRKDKHKKNCAYFFSRIFISLHFLISDTKYNNNLKF